MKERRNIINREKRNQQIKDHCIKVWVEKQKQLSRGRKKS